MIASNPLDGGKLTMKSMDTFSHGPWKIGNSRNNPTCFFIVCLILLVGQASVHVLLCIIFQIRPIIGLLEECYGALCTTMAFKGPSWHSFKSTSLNFRFGI
jgi:hypothetical protein